MSKTPHQSHQIFIKLIGFILVPLLMAVPFNKEGMIQKNYTGLLNDPQQKYKCLLCTIPCLIFWRILIVHAGHLQHQHRWNLPALVTAALSAGCILIPYHVQEDFLSGLHVLVGFLAFVMLNVMMMHLLWLNRKLCSFYLGGLAAAWLTALTAASINGLSEWIYSVVLSLTLTILYLKA